MRIIAGHCRAIKLKSPAGSNTRPTADRTRQTLFDMITHASWGGLPFVQNAHILDGFSGTGALGLEALSRGAKTACFFEIDLLARCSLKENIERCHMQEFTTIYKDALHPPPATQPCSLIFLDPPYRQNLIPLALNQFEQKGWLAQKALLVTEIAIDEILTLNENFVLLAERNIGLTALKIWQSV